MELLLQGSSTFRYGLIVNEGGAGNVRFALNDKAGTIPVLDINSVSSLNYADGKWHYLLATYDPSSGPLGKMTLTIANEDGTANTASVNLATAFPGFDGLPAGGDGDLRIGRENPLLSADERTFLGLIDEVQLSAGIVPSYLRLGALPGDSFLPSDFNRSGTVDNSDLGIWQTNFGTSSGAQYFDGDADGDGDVDGQDFLCWQRDLSLFTTLHSASMAVPEPSLAVYLWLALGLTSTVREFR